MHKNTKKLFVRRLPDVDADDRRNISSTKDTWTEIVLALL